MMDCIRSLVKDDTKLYGLLALSTVGTAYLLSYVISLLRMTIDLVRPGIPLTRFGSRDGAYAVVTGATAGIGREFALQLARAGFNVVIAGRSPAKLAEVRAEILAASPAATVVAHTIDFAVATPADYAAFGAVLAALDVGVLINNVGKSYDSPTFFQDLPDADAADILEINVGATIKTTKLVLPTMLSKKRGLILTVGSFAALIPSPLLAVYSGSKACVATWSQALGSELRGTGVEVELLNASFVVSKLSKIRRASLSVPTPETYVRCALSKIGVNGGAVGKPHISTPYIGHAPAQWAIDNLLTDSFWLWYNRKLHLDIRRRVLKKKAREEAAKVSKTE